VAAESSRHDPVARALSASIFTEADDLAQLRESVREAVACHFDERKRPAIIRLLFTREEIIVV
jgi:HEAT repeat protein